MTATSLRLPTVPALDHMKPRLSLSHQYLNLSVKFSEPPNGRRYILFASASISHEGHARSPAEGKNNSAQVTKMQKVDDGFPSDFDSKDSPSLPKPLTSTQLSSFPSGGSSLRVAYQGVRGAFSESAAEKAYPNCEAVPCEQFDTAFEAVERWLVDRAVLPIENSLGGSIHRNYDLLLRHRLHIVGEVKLAVRHCLLANHGAKVEDLKRVISHPQALAQCENTLTKLGLVREAVDDTAGAAKSLEDITLLASSAVSLTFRGLLKTAVHGAFLNECLGFYLLVAFHKLMDTGAIASAAASEIYGLNILVQDIQDDSENVTRFLMLAREPIIPGTDKPFKTSIVFSLEEGPGVLFKALAVFAMRDINLTKIESRPLQKQAIGVFDDNTNGFPKYFPYLFYVDFEASMADQRAQNALAHLKEFATVLRVLGSYPVDAGVA